MKIHLIDGTYELFRHYFGAPARTAPDGREVGAVVGLLRSLHSLLGRDDVTHIACAFDHVIESFRNDLYPGYKTGEGIDPDLYGQFQLAEEAVAALGVIVWPMIEFEADDALAAGAARFSPKPEVDQVLLCSPDKDLAQCVSGERLVMWDRRRDQIINESGVVEKFGVPPPSIPDWLALVGDSADGYPGLPGWGAKSAATVLSRFGRLEAIPREVAEWGLPARRAASLEETLRSRWDEVVLYRRLATLRDDADITGNLEDLEWKGAYETLHTVCQTLGETKLTGRIRRWRSGAPADLPGAGRQD